jgi:hypothetical protein
VSWPFRFRVPRNLYLRVDVWWLEVWYPLVGWTCVNNAVIAFGQIIVLYAVFRVGSVAETGEERQALLSP